MAQKQLLPGRVPRTLIYEVMKPDTELVVEVERNPEGSFVAFRKRRSRFVIPARLFKKIVNEIPALVHAIDSMDAGFSYASSGAEAGGDEGLEKQEEEEDQTQAQDWDNAFYTPPPKQFYQEAGC